MFNNQTTRKRPKKLKFTSKPQFKDIKDDFALINETTPSPKNDKDTSDMSNFTAYRGEEEED